MHESFNFFFCLNQRTWWDTTLASGMNFKQRMSLHELMGDFDLIFNDYISLSSTICVKWLIMSCKRSSNAIQFFWVVHFLCVNFPETKRNKDFKYKSTT